MCPCASVCVHAWLKRASLASSQCAEDLMTVLRVERESTAHRLQLRWPTSVHNPELWFSTLNHLHPHAQSIQNHFKTLSYKILIIFICLPKKKCTKTIQILNPVKCILFGSAFFHYFYLQRCHYDIRDYIRFWNRWQTKSLLGQQIIFYLILELAVCIPENFYKTNLKLISFVKT